MQDQNNSTPVPTTPSQGGVSVAAGTAPTTNPDNSLPEDAGMDNKAKKTAKDTKNDEINTIRGIVDKIKDSDNILVALSKDPTADEIAAAIGLTLYLEQLGKYTTAIYSGETPNILRFLEPEKTFETNTDGLQDFIIALNKEKADHLRYKLDGDYVKIFITPYHTRIGKEDLEFSYGDYNVGLVIALNVPTPSDLDSALTEHGRILHDAGTIDITTSEPGRFGEIEWSDPSRSSISEMVADLLIKIQEPAMRKETATALLAGIVSATDRFSKENTAASTLAVSSKLMELGADQQLVTINVRENMPLELVGAVDVMGQKKSVNGGDPTRLTIHHEENDSNEESTDANIGEDSEDAKAIADAAANAMGIANETKTENDDATNENGALAEVPTGSAAETPVQTETPAEVPAPPDYGKMMEEALKEPLVGQEDFAENNMAGDPGVPGDGAYLVNSAPAIENTGAISENTSGEIPEEDVNGAGVLPMPGQEEGILPPPMTPKVDFSAVPPMESSELGGTNGVGINPVDPVMPTVETQPMIPTAETQSMTPTMGAQPMMPTVETQPIGNTNSNINQLNNTVDNGTTEMTGGGVDLPPVDPTAFQIPGAQGAQ